MQSMSSRGGSRTPVPAAEAPPSATAGLSQAAIDLLAALDAIEDYPDEPILLDSRGLVIASRRLDVPAGSVGTLGQLV